MVRFLKRLRLIDRPTEFAKRTWIVEARSTIVYNNVTHHLKCCICGKEFKDKDKCWLIQDEDYDYFNCMWCVEKANVKSDRTIPKIIDRLKQPENRSYIPVILDIED